MRPALAALGLVLCAAPAAAQDLRHVLGGAAVHEAEAETFLAARGRTSEPVSTPLAAPGLVLSDLAPLVSAEAALRDARELSARFREADALSRLLEAERALVEQGLDLPLAHALLAELDLQIALLAAALGERGLSDTALAKALTLDPARRLLAAEAPPELVARARELERQRDGAARAALHIEGEGAQVELDGVRLGVSPVDTQVPPGVHLLVLRAPGMQPYARVLRAFGGGTIAVRLSPRPEVDTQARLAAQHDLPAAEPPAAQLSALTNRAVWLFAPDPSARMTRVAHCTNGACLREDDLRWAEEVPLSRAETRPVWKRWPLWLGVAGGVLAATGAALWAAREPPTREERVLTLDPGNPSPAP